MGHHLTPNISSLDDIHALNRLGVDIAKVPQHTRNERRSRVMAEDRIKVMQGVSNLVDVLRHWLALVSFFFEEKRNVPCRFEEIKVCLLIDC